MSGTKDSFGSRVKPTPDTVAEEAPNAPPAPVKVDGPENRRAPRRRVLFTGRIVYGMQEMTVECAIQNISQTGARVRLAGVEALQPPVYLVDIRHGLAFRAHVRWRDGDRAGLSFSEYSDLSNPDVKVPTIVRRLWLDYLR
jgi:hypothetical protein